MPAAGRDALAVIERFLVRRRPGPLLALLARTSLPLVGVEGFAARRPEVEADDASPILVALAAPTTGDGPLAGAAVVVKDALDVAGVATGVGLRDGGPIAEADAAIVARLRAAGGRLVGKTVMTELGMDGLGALVHTAMPHNPRAPGYFPGGSSTGTAVAIARGLARYGVGSDGLGSVRIPAAFCGLVGLKPGRNRLPAAGYRSPVATLDACGPIARTADDCARLWQVLAGEPIATLAPAVPARIGVARQLGPARAARSIQRAFARMLAALGVAPVAVDLPGGDRATLLGGMLGAVELARSAYADLPLSPAGRMNVALGRAFAPWSVARLYDQRATLVRATEAALDRVDVLAMPTTAIPPPAITRALAAGAQDLGLLRALGAYTPLANLTGLPAIAAPCGVDERGRPLSIMFVGRTGSETELLQLALAVERTGLATAPIATRE